MNEPYEPEVNDYVIWDRGEYGSDEGWVYFKGDPVVERKGFRTNPRYITIETHVEDKPPELLECKTKNPHKKIHCLLLCYEQDWNQLKFVRRRKKQCPQHYSECED